MVEVLEEKAVDPDIEAILNEIGLDWLRATDAYSLGYIEGQQYLHDTTLLNIKNAIVPPAELFYHKLQRIIPKGDILQHRIGTDYTTGVPTTLTVIAHKHNDKMMEIHYMASDLELYLYREHGINCQFWPITDAGLEQSLVDIDFPYCRKDI